jgi:hypothetical protein
MSVFAYDTILCDEGDVLSELPSSSSSLVSSISSPSVSTPSHMHTTLSPPSHTRSLSSPLLPTSPLFKGINSLLEEVKIESESEREEVSTLSTENETKRQKRVLKKERKILTYIQTSQSSVSLGSEVRVSESVSVQVTTTEVLSPLTPV